MFELTVKRGETIAIDLDGCIVDFNRGYIAWHNQQTGQNVRYHDVRIYDYSQTPLGGTLEDHIRNIDELGKTDFGLGLSPLRGAISLIKTLSETNPLIVLTARGGPWSEVSEEWLRINGIHDCFDQFIFLGSYRGDTKVTKGEVCKDKGIRVALEDAYHNTIGLSQNGVSTFMPIRPWNEDLVRYGNTGYEVSDEQFRSSIKPIYCYGCDMLPHFE